MQKEHIEKLQFLLGHSDVSTRKQGLSLLTSFDNYTEVFTGCQITQNGQISLSFGCIQEEILEGWFGSGAIDLEILNTISVIGAENPIACAHVILKYCHKDIQIWVYPYLWISMKQPFPWLPLDEEPTHGLIQHGAWNNQKIDTLADFRCWFQTSDWNILWLTHPCPNASQYTISIQGYRTSTQNQSHYFRFLSERSNYNDTTTHISLANREDTISFQSSIKHHLIDGPGEIPAITDQWYHIKGVIDTNKKKVQIEINDQLMGVWIMEEYPQATFLSMGSNGVAWKIPANSGWRNLYIDFTP